MAGVKQEAVNTFEKGIVKDLNPINTPTTVLTDCVNGTIITYDGNEYQLQNDKGNYLLKYSKLPEGFVPIGTASYGDILYIVSYNPITKETEIGTFPTPATHKITTPDVPKDAKSILKRANITGDAEYEDLMNNYYQLVQFGATEDYKLYPGDRYKIEMEDEDGCPYESLHYYIITDENEIIEITDNIVYESKKDEDGFKYITWEVPGWLAVRWDLPVIEDFKIFPKSINPNTGVSKINYQLTSNDENVKEAFKDGNLSIITEESTTNGEVEKSIDTYDAIRYLNLTYPLVLQVKDEYGNLKDSISIKARPSITSCGTNILYPKADPYVIDLTSRFSEDNTKIADEYYYYRMDDKAITLNFNVDASVVTTGEVQLFIYAVPVVDYITNKYSVENLNWKEISGGNVFDGVGQQIIQMDLSDNDDFKNFNENILLVKIELTDGLSTVNKYKTTIASELINNFSRNDYSDFSKIPVTEWAQYLNEIRVSFDNSAFVEPSYVKVSDEVSKNKTTSPYSVEEYKEKFWNITETDDTSGFFPEEDIELTIKDSFKYELDYKAAGNGRVRGRIEQKYLYNFCEVNFSSYSQYSVTGSSVKFGTKEFDFIPDGEVKPYAEQTIEVPEDLSETHAETFNYSKDELLPVWNGNSAINLLALKEGHFSGTNFRVYTNRLSVGSPYSTSCALIDSLYNELKDAWEKKVQQISYLARLNVLNFYKVGLRNKKELQTRFDEIAIDILSCESKNLDFLETKYFCKGLPVPKAIWYIDFVAMGSLWMNLRPINVDKALTKVLEDFKGNYIGCKLSVEEIYDAPKYKNIDDGIPTMEATSTFAAIKSVFKDTNSSILPAIVWVKQQNNPKCTAFASNRFSNYIAANTDRGDRNNAGILINDVKSGPLFIPLVSYSNTKKKYSNDPVSKYNYKTDGKMTAGYDNFVMNYQGTNDVPGFRVIQTILNSIKVNLIKRKNSSGYFIQKEESYRDIYTDVPIAIEGFIYVDSINVLGVGNIKYIQSHNDNFLYASEFIFNRSDCHINTVSDNYYHVTDNGKDINTLPLKNAMDETRTEMQAVNEIVLNQYNTYPEFELVKYTNEGRSIGYINANVEDQPLVSDLVRDILRWDGSITYNSDKVSLFDVRVNGEGYKKMYFISMTNKEIGDADFDFEDATDEKNDPRIPICYSIIDRDQLLGEFYTEEIDDQEDVEITETTEDISSSSAAAAGVTTTTAAVASSTPMNAISSRTVTYTESWEVGTTKYLDINVGETITIIANIPGHTFGINVGNSLPVDWEWVDSGIKITGKSTDNCVALLSFYKKGQAYSPYYLRVRVHNQESLIEDGIRTYEFNGEHRPLGLLISEGEKIKIRLTEDSGMSVSINESALPCTSTHPTTYTWILTGKYKEGIDFGQQKYSKDGSGGQVLFTLYYC